MSEDKKEKEITNRKFSEINNEFITACEDVKIKPSGRQASKWRNEKGLAWKSKHLSK